MYRWLVGAHEEFSGGDSPDLSSSKSFSTPTEASEPKQLYELVAPSLRLLYCLTCLLLHSPDLGSDKQVQIMRFVLQLPCPKATGAGVPSHSI